MTDRQKVLRGAEYVVVLLIAGVVLFPLFWIVLTAFKTGMNIFSLKIFFQPVLVNFRRVLFNPHHFTRNIANSFFVGGVATFVGIAVAIPAAYGFSRFPIRGKNSILFWIISLQFIPPIVVLLPIYAFFRNMYMLDTHFALITIYLTIVIPFSIWIIKTFIDGIPLEIEESATIDGASYLKILWHIILPLAGPAIIVAAIFCLILTLNEFLFALVLTTVDAVTMPIGLMGLETTEGIQWGDMAAIGTIMLIPMCFFAFTVQKYIVRGLTLGAIK